MGRTSSLLYCIERYEKFGNIPLNLLVLCGLKHKNYLAQYSVLWGGEIILNVGDTFHGLQSLIGIKRQERFEPQPPFFSAPSPWHSALLSSSADSSTTKKSHRYFHVWMQALDTTLKSKYYFRWWIYMEAPWLHVICKPDISSVLGK